VLTRVTRRVVGAIFLVRFDVGLSRARRNVLSNTGLNAMRFALAILFLAVLTSSSNAQSASPLSFYLRGLEPSDNPSLLFLNNTAPTTAAAKSKDSSSINFSGGNPWKEVGTWTAEFSVGSGMVTGLSDLRVWLGLKNSDDQGTNFDVRAELYKNGVLLSSGVTLCVVGVTKNPNNAKEVTVSFAPISATSFNARTDVLTLKILTRIGTTATGARCGGGHSNATGLRLYFDASSRPSRFNSTFVSDNVPPTITATVTPAPNAAGWNNSNPTVTFTCADESSGIASCPEPVSVASETAGEIIVGTAVDVAGNMASATVTVKLDRTPPNLNFTSPTDGSRVFASPVVVLGTVEDTLSGFSSLTCNGVAGTLTGTNFRCAVALTPGANSINGVATDVAGNISTLPPLALNYARVPTVTFTSPANLSYLNLSPTTVTGTVDDPTATVTVNSISAPVANGQFSIMLPLAEGPNIVTATATSADGAAGNTSIEVTLDTTPPHVTITSPPNRFVTTDESITVAGNVNDIVVGTVNDQQAQVTVNGSTAQVANRMFVATNVPLNIGDNVIQAVGRDRVGNAVTNQITVTRREVTDAQISQISGNNQTSVIGTVLGAPLVVALTDSEGNPVPDKPVIFKVSQDNGMVSAGGAPAPSAIAITNAQGQAQAQWTLGTRAGAGANSVEAYSVGFAGTAIFTATGTLGPAGKIVIDTGNNQIGEVNQPLPKPLIAVVVDSGNNRLGGVPVTFTVKQGGGSFGGQPSLTVNTDSDGRAAATMTLGFQEGNANNLVEANFPGNQGFHASFTATGRAPGNPAGTTISGVVLDNSNVPIQGVTIRAVLTNLLNSNSSIIQSVAAVQTDAQGQFTIPQAPVGFVKLLVDGSTAQRPGTYPTLDYDMVTVAGVNNTVGMPIFLLPLNTSNQLCVTATTGGGTLTIPEAPGFSLTFGPGQVTFPGGSKTGCISVTVVHGDKVPMVPGFGQQPRFIVTIQPAGAVFNLPAAITLPNVDGLPPRAVTEMYSFDHDIGSFVAIGTGIVSDDGQVIRSSPGVGVLKAGWHCGGDPNQTGTAATCPDCQKCQGTRCVEEPKCTACGNDPQKVCEGVGGPCVKINNTEFTIKYATYIPDNNIPGPAIHPQSYCTALALPPVRRLFFKGDNRSSSSAFGASSRGAQQITLVPEQCKDPDGFKEGSYAQRNDQTRAYASDALDDGTINAADDDGVANDCKLFHNSGFAGTGTFRFSTTRVGPHAVKVLLDGSPADPLIALSPHIDWTLEITIDTSNPDVPRYTITGTHDGFPDHEIYINGRQVYFFHGTDISALWGGTGDVHVNKSGTLP
jgi:glucodextranase-like protein